MGRHNKEKRRAYRKRRRQQKRKLKQHQTDKVKEDHQSDVSSFPSLTTYPFGKPDVLTTGSDAGSKAPSITSRGQLCVKAALNRASNSTSQTNYERGDIPRRVQNDWLFSKREEYMLLYKQLTLVKQRLNIMEYGERMGRRLNAMKVDIPR